MYGMVNRALQRFLRETYGEDAWADIARAAGLRIDEFEPLVSYPPELTHRLLTAAADRLRQDPGDLLEDLGTHLVAAPSYEAPRRLLRFGGETLAEFLHSVDEVPERLRLALPDFDIPRVEVAFAPPGSFVIGVAPGLPGVSRVLTGVLRGLADDYGALAIIDHAGGPGGEARITVDVRDAAFAKGRRFDLAARVAS
jgi:hypothetical protein